MFMRILIICLLIFVLGGCNSNKHIKDIDYEKKVEYVNPISECPYQNVSYKPHLRCDYYLDIDNIEKANGYYKVENPTAVIMFKLTTSDNVEVYLNDLNEYIVVVK